MAKATGWTLEYIDTLTVESIWQYLSVTEGAANARNSLRGQH